MNTSNDFINFHQPDASDRDWIKNAAFTGHARSDEYAFANIVSWSSVYSTTIACVEGRIVVHDGVGDAYGWGAGDASRLDAFVSVLARDAAARGRPLAFWGLDHDDRVWLASHYPDCFDFSANEDFWEYCYAIDHLANLPGGKFQKKRNHIHAFEKEFPNWRVEQIIPANHDACLAVTAAWDAEDAADGTRDRSSEDGEHALRTALAHTEDWQLDGLILFANAKPIAFSLGERLSSDFYDVLFEKAPRELNGAYAMINREFARFIARRYPEIRYLNREDAVGEAHLQKAKDSYHPDLMVEKHTARLREGVRL